MKRLRKQKWDEIQVDPGMANLGFKVCGRRSMISQNVAWAYLRALGNLGSHVGRKLYSGPAFAQTHILLVGDAIVHPRHMQSTSSPRGLPALVACRRVTHDDRNLNPSSDVTKFTGNSTRIWVEDSKKVLFTSLWFCSKTGTQPQVKLGAVNVGRALFCVS